MKHSKETKEVSESAEYYYQLKGEIDAFENCIAILQGLPLNIAIHRIKVNRTRAKQRLSRLQDLPGQLRIFTKGGEHE